MNNKVKKNQDFNPIKQDVDGKQARRMIWSTNSINLALKGLTEGRRLVANPFYENNTKLLKGDLVFKRTSEEIEEWKRCANDIEYFANTYCKLMTPEGVKNITLRDYQMEYLKHLEKHRMSIMVSCRQAGKCLTYNQVILCCFNDNFWNQFDNKLKKYFDSNYYIKEEDCYSLPLFEIINLYKIDIRWKVEYNLYKILYKLELWKKKENLKEVKGAKTGKSIVKDLKNTINE